MRRSARPIRLASRLVFNVSIGSGSARRQFGHSSLVDGMFGRSSTAMASSSVAVRMREGARASASCTLATTSAGGADAGGARHPLHAPADFARARFVRRQAELLLDVQVGAGPQAGDRRQVVGRDGGESVLGILRRAGLLEPEQAVGQDVVRRELLARRLLHHAQVLADDHRARPLALERDDRQQIIGVALDEGAVARVAALGDPEQPEQPHHVIDAQSAGVAEARADGLDEGLVTGAAQPGMARTAAGPSSAPWC